MGCGVVGGWRMHLRKCVHNMQHKWKCRLENILFLGPTNGIDHCRSPSVTPTTPWKCTNFPNAPHEDVEKGGGWQKWAHILEIGRHFSLNCVLIVIHSECVWVCVWPVYTGSQSPLYSHTHTHRQRGKIWKFWLHVSIQNGAAKTNSNWWWGMPILTRRRTWAPFLCGHDCPVVGFSQADLRGGPGAPNCSASWTLDFCALAAPVANVHFRSSKRKLGFQNDIWNIYDLPAQTLHHLHAPS